jgi:hypothetical protein
VHLLQRQCRQLAARSSVLSDGKARASDGNVQRRVIGMIVNL